MNRREFFKIIALATVVNPVDLMAAAPYIQAEKGKITVSPTPVIEPTPPSSPVIIMGDQEIKDYLSKVRQPNVPHKKDIILASPKERRLLADVVGRLDRVRAHVGHGNFCLLGLDESYAVGRYGAGVGRFTPEERAFLEEIFWRDASEYGFHGEKQILRLDEEIKSKDVNKIPYTGNFLFHGASTEMYETIKNDLGEKLILTSGIRGLAKQFLLFLDKAQRFNGNLSLASRSLAPPGYSFHATGDFDVGQRGYGGANFSEKFLESEVYAELIERGYVRYRYEKDNLLGVRYEPWHIKV